MTRRLAVAALAGLAALAFSTACTTGGGGAAAPTTPAKTATEILNEAAQKSASQSFAFDLSYGDLLTGEGKRDADGTNAQSRMKISEPTSGVVITAEVLAVGDDIYMKLDFGPLTSSIPGLGGIGDKWMHVDRSRLSAGGGLGSSLNPSGDSMSAQSIIKGVVSAEKVSDTEIKGTLDLAKSAPPGVSAADLGNLGADAKNIPFTASLDSEGRIAKITIDMPAIGTFPATQQITTYSDYGEQVTVTKPPANQTVEAPELVYQFL